MFISHDVIVLDALRAELEWRGLPHTLIRMDLT
jgi:hypothetical protein